MFTKHGEIREFDKDCPICCLDSEGNLFPSCAYAARFHNVSPSTTLCSVIKPNFKSKHYNKKISIIEITDDEYNKGKPFDINWECVRRRAEGEHIYITAINKDEEWKEDNMIIKKGIIQKLPYFSKEVYYYQKEDL